MAPGKVRSAFSPDSPNRLILPRFGRLAYTPPLDFANGRRSRHGGSPDVSANCLDVRGLVSGSFLGAGPVPGRRRGAVWQSADDDGAGHEPGVPAVASTADDSARRSS